MIEWLINAAITVVFVGTLLSIWGACRSIVKAMETLADAARSIQKELEDDLDDD